MPEESFPLRNSEKIKVKGDDLNKLNLYSYGIGHVLNDITASCWFNFLPYFLTEIISISNDKAGIVMLSGQVADALATPLVGLLSDKFETRCGKRTPWYLGGTVLVIICFSLIFQPCFICSENNSETTMQLIYYIILPSLFNIGWAAVQVAHMSLLPIISINKKNKDSMVRLRTGFTFISQFVSLVISFIIFTFVEDKQEQYSYLSLSCVIVGLITTCVFLVNCKEVKLSENIDKYVEEIRTSLGKSKEDNNNLLKYPITNETTIQLTKQSTQENIDWSYWMKKTDFYAYMMVYMFVRLSINITGSMIPFYLQFVLNFERGPQGQTPITFSIVLLVSMSGSVFNSLVIQKFLLKSKDRLVMIMYSGLFVCIGCLPIIYIVESNRWIIYILCFIFGLGFSLGLSTASSLINDVVGSKGKKGAFVYGAYSFSDKMSCGIVLFFFMKYVKNNGPLLKFMTALLAPISMLFAFLMVFIMKKMIIVKDKKDTIPIKIEDKDAKNNDSIIDDSRISYITLK